VTNSATEAAVAASGDI